jgi:hypothetical protein
VRLAAAFGALAVGSAGVTVTALPRPAFPGPAANVPSAHRLVLVSSRYRAPGSLPAPRELRGAPESFRGLPLAGGSDQIGTTLAFYGRDSATARIVVAVDPGTIEPRYAFDFKNYVWPPRIRPGEREFVYEQVVWAHEAGGTLYVENAHSTYASSSYGRNAYITAIDLKTKKPLWRSPALVANAGTFLVDDRYLMAGYGFTREPDYLYLLDRRTGRAVERLLLPSAPERITWRGRQIHVRTYDHDVVVSLRED